MSERLLQLGRCHFFFGFLGGVGLGFGLGFCLPIPKFIAPDLPRVGGGAGFFAISCLRELVLHQNNKLNIASEALRQTELHLEDINHLASNADQRAMALSGTLAAIATILASLAANTPAPLFSYLSCGGFIASGFLAASSCMPRLFHIRGHRWESWKEHVVDNDELIDVLTSQAEENDLRIKENFDKLEQAARTTRRSFTFAFWVFCFFLFSQLGALSR